MTHIPRILVILGITLWTCIAVSPSLHGQSLFRDNFADGKFDDNQPVTWQPWQGSEISIEDGSLIVQNAGDGISSVEIPDMRIANTSLRTDLRAHDGEGAFVYVRSQSLPGVRNGYVAGINLDGRAVIMYDGTGEVLEEVQTEFDPSMEDLRMQLDSIDDVVSLWLWHPSHPMPEQPLLTATDDSGFEGWIGVGVFGGNAAFRYVHVGQSTIISGDFNGNGILDAEDLNIMSKAMISDALFDLDNDDDVDADDRRMWVHELRLTWFGDANLDGEFNSRDLVTVFSAGEYEDAIENNSTWATGDWDGNGDFNSGDLVEAFGDGGYEQGPKAAVRPVPEASSWILLTLGFLGIRRACSMIVTFRP